METRLETLEAVLDREVRPQLSAHGGDVEVISLSADGVCSLRLLGACSGCPAADLGTRDLIEECLREALPDIQKIELVHCVSEDLLDAARAILRSGAGEGMEEKHEKS